MKHSMIAIAVLAFMNVNAQKTDFSGTWAGPQLEMIDGIQYLNAIASEIKVTQTKDSITLERTTPSGEDKSSTSKETLAINGKASTITTSSKRTKSSLVSWSANGKTLTLVTTYSYPDKPTEIEFRNTETWEIGSDGSLTIIKNSDATVTDDWTIRAVYSKK